MKQTKTIFLFCVALLIIIAASFLEFTSNKGIAKDYDLKIAAAELTQKAFNEVKKEKIARNIPLDSEDINQTGMIGVATSPITSTLSPIPFKRTITNPNYAAALVDMLLEGGMKKGDHIVLNFSGSFPSMNIAAMAACQVLELKPIIFSSIGASTYGANILEFNYLHMDELLYQSGILKNKAKFVSLGAQNDIGEEFSDDTRQYLIKEINNFGRTYFEEHDFQTNIEKRMNLAASEAGLSGVKGFINVGGNTMGLGTSPFVDGMEYGLIRPNPNVKIYKGKSGLIEHYLSKDVPVISILNVRGIGDRYGLPYDPTPIPKIGDGGVYFERTYNLFLAYFILVVVIASGGSYYFIKRYRNNKNKSLTI